MKKFIHKHKTAFLVTSILLLWRLYLLIIETFRYIVPFRNGYLGFIPQANFDGVYYLAISQYWYRGLDQAFFPLYPVSIWLTSNVLIIKSAASGIMVSVLSIFFLLFFLNKLMEFDKLKKYAIWSLIFYLSFPTSFFLAAVYTESLFIFLVILSFYLARRGNKFLSSLAGAFASGTRVIGIFLLPALLYEFYSQYKDKKMKLSFSQMIKYFSPFLLIPAGLLGYMFFLWYKYSDPLLFVHIQPQFGAGRSGGEVILLPQVIYRYIKIFSSIPSSDFVFWVSALEFTLLILSLTLLYFAYKRGMRISYIIFSFFALIFPTLSGTLSSYPRYFLVAFPIFIFLGTLKKVSLKVALIIIGLTIEAILAVLFYQGYFVS